MSYFNYVNTFKPGPNPETPRFLPDTDVDVVTGQNSNLGAMLLAFTHDLIVVPTFVSTPNGLVLEVANTSQEPPPMSKTVYVVSKITSVDQIDHLPNKFEYAPFLSAELEFDSPNCSSYDYSPDIPHFDALPSTWAVGLNFKTGDQTDNPTDGWLRIGPTCQFKNGGDIYFHMTDFPGKQRVWSDTYKNYADTNAVFTLRLLMSRSETQVHAAASLSLNSEIIASGQILSQGTMDDPEMTDIPVQNLNEARTNPYKITAIGVALVNLGPVPEQPLVAPLVSVRLRKFSLRYPTAEVKVPHPFPSGA
jgi:hypothetical protein